ncbi:hypothetical protein DFJ73DRAFT_815632 [Zopfochytrium polystomum]|nr:hypothetical protein DFJ73DRAFT_815632 [Zopfochytrium polystomum]
MGVNEFDEDEGCEHQRTASLVLIGGMGGDAAQRSSSGTIASGPLGASVPVQRSGLPHPKKTAFAVLAESPSVVERLRSVEIAYADVIHGHSMDRLLDKTLPAIYAEVDEAVAEVLDQTPVEGWSENCHPQLASFILLNFISSKVLTPLPCIDDKYSSLAGVLRSKSWWSQRRFAQDERQLFMKPHEWEHVRRWCRNTADETEMGGKTVVPSVTSWVSLCKKRE